MLKNFLKNWLGIKDSDSYSQVNMVMPSHAGLDDTYLFDFRNWASDYGGHGGTMLMAPQAVMAVGEAATVSTEPPMKIKIKPIEVLKELEGVPNPVSLALLDDKINILKDKSKLITQHYSRKDIDGLIERMENRKKYTEHKEYFERFQITNDAKIGQLLEKYDLVMKAADLFIPEFPDEAIALMTGYTERVDAICKKKPVFYVIAENDMFRKAYETRDPILLVQSPFGFFWQILGAWDKEMLLLSEL